MKQIIFFTTPTNSYGYDTVESEFTYAPGAVIEDPENGSRTILKSVPATRENYQYAKSLMSFCRRHRRMETFKYNIDRMK